MQTLWTPDPVDPSTDIDEGIPPNDESTVFYRGRGLIADVDEVW